MSEIITHKVLAKDRKVLLKYLVECSFANNLKLMDRLQIKHNQICVLILKQLMLFIWCLPALFRVPSTKL